MKILHIISSMNPIQGGVCQAVRNLIPAMDAGGSYNEVVSFDPPDAPFIGQDSFVTHALGIGKGPYRYQRKFIRWLMLNMADYEVLIVHGLWQYTNFGTYRALKCHLRKQTKKSPKLYVMPHGMLDPYFQSAANRRVKALRNLVFWYLVEKRVMNWAHGVLFTCEEERNLASTTFTQYKPKATFVVGLGIVEPPSENEVNSAPFFTKFPTIKALGYILFISRIHEKKGIDQLIEAYLKRLQAFPDMDPLVIAGPGLETDYGQMLFKLSQSASGKIVFTDMLTGDMKWTAFYNCRFFILPSHQENFGIVVAEALACSKPVLISDKVNIWREIIEEKGGVVAPDTPNGVAALLERAFDMPIYEETEMRCNARAVYENHFSIDKASRKLLQVLRLP